MDDDKAIEESVRVYKALGEPTRLRIIQLLRKQELSCTEVEERLHASSSSIISHHMKQLADCGLLKLRKDGTYRYYRVDQDVLKVYMPMENE